MGTELELFACVHNWKVYWGQMVRPYVRGDVLEVGAGIGANREYLDNSDIRRWVCLEPDIALAEELKKKAGPPEMDARYDVVCGTLQSLDARELFDSIVYIDVLEHIEKDAEELECAGGHLRRGGRVVVLAPAHQWLFTAFDASIGHWRRYDRVALKKISPAGLDLERLVYLDSVGLLASGANRVLLRQALPTKQGLAMWDTYMVPLSKLLDPLMFHSLGKSVLAVWRRT